MRWLSHSPRNLRDDRGIASIFVVIAMGALLVSAAVGIDVGRYVLEARRAQNSADATVLAVATDCARGAGAGGDYSPYRRGDHSISGPYCGDHETSITATGPVSNGLVLRRNSGEVRRDAAAAWGTLGTATTIPLIISDCEFSEALLDGASDVIIYIDDPTPHTGCSSLPGGFGQLASANDCSVTVNANGTVAGSTGGDLHKLIPCIAPLPRDVLIPMYSAAGLCPSCKGKGPYPVLGFAAFRITGYVFNGNRKAGTMAGQECPDQTRGRYCLRGDFIRMTTSQGTPGPSTDFGAVRVYLVS